MKHIVAGLIVLSRGPTVLARGHGVRARLSSSRSLRSGRADRPGVVVCVLSGLYQPVLDACIERLVSVFSRRVFRSLRFKPEVRRTVLLFKEHGSAKMVVEAG